MTSEGMDLPLDYLAQHIRAPFIDLLINTVGGFETMAIAG